MEAAEIATTATLAGAAMTGTATATAFGVINVAVASCGAGAEGLVMEVAWVTGDWDAPVAVLELAALGEAEDGSVFPRSPVLF